MSGVPGGGGWDTLYSEVQCIMNNGHMGPSPREHTDACENITFPQLRLRAVIKFRLRCRYLAIVTVTAIVLDNTIAIKN